MTQHAHVDTLHMVYAQQGMCTENRDEGTNISVNKKYEKKHAYKRKFKGARQKSWIIRIVQVEMSPQTQVNESGYNVLNKDD